MALELCVCPSLCRLSCLSTVLLEFLSLTNWILIEYLSWARLWKGLCQGNLLKLTRFTEVSQTRVPAECTKPTIWCVMTSPAIQVIHWSLEQAQKCSRGHSHTLASWGPFPSQKHVCFLCLFLQESEQTWLWLLFGNSVFLKVPFKRQKERKKNVRLWLIETAPGAGTSTPCFFDTSGFLKEASDQKLEWNIQLERHKSEAITATQEPWVKSGASPVVYPC